jgi:hypothetical protein
LINQTSLISSIFQTLRDFNFQHSHKFTHISAFFIRILQETTKLPQTRNSLPYNDAKIDLVCCVLFCPHKRLFCSFGCCFLLDYLDSDWLLQFWDWFCDFDMFGYLIYGLGVLLSWLWKIVVMIFRDFWAEFLKALISYVFWNFWAICNDLKSRIWSYGLAQWLINS